MKKSVLIFLVFAVASACTVTVKETFDKQTDFSQYKTYCWMAGCEFNVTGPDYLNDSIARENIRKAIEAELKQKGLTIRTDNPDLLVGFTFIAPLELDKKVINYQKGSLIIGMADAKESRMVWQSHVSAYMETKPDLSEANINKGIKQALKNYPPKK